MVMLFFADIWTKTNPETGETVQLNGYALTLTNAEGGEMEKTPAIWIVMVAGLAAGMSIYSITRYSNRLGQIRLNFFNTLFIIGTMAIMFIMANQGRGMIDTENPGQFLWGFYLPFGALVLNSLANRFIYRDEKLVREANRIR